MDKGASLTTCQRCGGSIVQWVGYSARALRRAVHSRSLAALHEDVEECQTCKHAWYYARTGRRITTHQFQRG